MTDFCDKTVITMNCKHREDKIIPMSLIRWVIRKYFEPFLLNNK